MGKRFGFGGGLILQYGDYMGFGAGGIYDMAKLLVGRILGDE